MSEEKPRKIEDILQTNIYDVDEEPHIVVDSEKCEKCEKKPCINLCPAHCFTLMGNKVLYSYEGCLECGTCRLVCPNEAVSWSYPKSGRGIHFRYG
jgi:ferredoxin like protein